MEYSVKGIDVPLSDKNFNDYIFKELSAHRPLNNFMTNVESGEGISTEDFQQMCIKTAKSLKSFVTEDDVIACICENEWLSTIPIIASLYLGTTIAMVNPAYNLRELVHNFSLSQPKTVFCKKNILQKILDAKSELSFIETVILLEDEHEAEVITIYDLMRKTNDITDFKPTSVNQSKTAVILSSSGTSGLPKAVMISYSNLTAALPYVTNSDYFDLTTDVVSLLLVPLFHIFGMYLAVYSVIVGSKVVFLKSFKPQSFLRSIQDYKINKLTIVPPLALFLAKSPLVDNYDLSSLQDVLCGAAPLPSEVLTLLQTRLKVKVRQMYGLTETGAIGMVTKSDKCNPNSTGSVTPNLQLIIKDPETKQILNIKKTGEICVKGPTVFKGYKSNIEETKNSFDENGYFLTGDVGYFDDDGHLCIVDRIKELIKYKGFQVPPTELEGILLTHPAVKDVAVIGITDERAGEVPCAVVVKHPAVEVEEEELVAFLKGKVAQYKELRGGVRFVDEIPKNANGKIMRRVIKKMF